MGLNFLLFVIMVQSRVKAGKDMELSVIKDGWVSKSSKPKLKWRVEGRNNIEKIINSGFNPVLFTILEFIGLNKYDVYNTITKLTREVKSYFIEEIKGKWVLYSEPYFSIKTRSQLSKITSEQYNDFLEKFYIHSSSTGLLRILQQQMVASNEGIIFKDGFVSINDIEFRTVIAKSQWKGYDRIQIQFRIKQ